MKPSSITAYPSTSYQYTIHICDDITHLSDSFLMQKYSSIVIFHDNFITATYPFESTQNLFKQEASISGAVFLSYPVSSGKHSKNLHTLSTLVDWLLDNRVQRDSLFVGIGGGVIGDLIGLLSSLYFRGVDLLHVPTNLLSMCDSCIGGKTALNSQFHVNTLGTYKHPVATIINMSFLHSLSRRDLRAGFAEIVKVSLLKDHNLFRSKFFDIPYLLDSGDKVRQILELSISHKLFFTTDDITEKSKRLFLNFGHTFAHAIECIQDLNFEEYYRHGEAVSLGIVCATALSDHIYGSSNLQYVKSLLDKYELPISLPIEFFDKSGINNSDEFLEKLVSLALTDKKGAEGKVRLVLLEKIDSPVICSSNDKDLLRYAFNSILS